MRRLVSGGLLLLLGGGTILSGSPSPGDWVRLESPNFVVYSGVPPSKTRQIAGQLEDFRSALAAALPGMTLTAANPTLVYVFGSRRTFEQYAAGKGKMDGFFTSTEDADYLVIDASAADPTRIAFHEYTHRVVDTISGVPLWLNEGLAHFYETVEFEPGRVLLGVPNAPLRSWVVGAAHPPLTEVLTATLTSSLYRDPEQTQLFRSLSWALVHYLLVDQRAAAGRLFARIKAGRPSTEAVPEAFGRPLEQLERDLVTYVRERMTYLRMPLEKSPAEIKFQELAPEEALARLNDLPRHNEDLVRRLAQETAAEGVVMAAALLAEGRKSEAFALLEGIASDKAIDEEVRSRARKLLDENR